MKLRKRLFAYGLTAAMSAGLLAGCGSAADTDGAADAAGTDAADTTAEAAAESGETLESGTVTLTVWAEENTFDMLTAMIEDFKEEYAGQADFDIQLVQQADSSTKDTLLGDIHAGADVFSFPDDQLSAMVAAGALEPVPNADEISAANLEDAVSAASYNGTLYAYPMTADNGYFLYYDKNYYSESDVTTLENILAVAEANGKQFSMEFNSGWYMYAFFGAENFELGINDDGVTNYCNWNTTEGSVTGLDVAQSLLTLTSSPAFTAQADGSFVTGVQDGSVIAGISGTWNAVSVAEAWGDDYGAVKLPTFSCAGQQIQMTSFTGYKMMGVNYYSEHKEWACKLAEWLTNEQNQTTRFEVMSQGPSNKNAAASDAVAQVPAIAAVIDQSQYGHLQRIGNNFWDPCTTFADTIAAGNPQGADLQELLDELVAGITASSVN